MRSDDETAPGDGMSPGDTFPDEPSKARGYGSLREDVAALYEDGKTYFQAEIAFQKSRAVFGAHHLQWAAFFAMGALAFLHLTLLGIVVGLIIALQPYLGAFGAMAVTVLGTLIVTALCGWLTLRRFRKIGGAFEESGS